MKLLKHIANLGYGSRKQVAVMFRDGRVTDAGGTALHEASAVAHADVRIDGATLDPAPGVVLMLHKPVGYTCSTRDPGRIVYELLPPRFRLRDPIIAPVGRLDRDTSGLLLLTDDGALLHKITSPRSHLPKLYVVALAQDLCGDEAALFASGTLRLKSDDAPLRPAMLEMTETRRARLTIVEGRYHQVRRMFAAVGNRVETLHRAAIGGLALGDLASARWRTLSPDEVAQLLVR